VIELDQDILRQALAEDQEDITTVVRKNSGGFSIKPIATEPSSNRSVTRLSQVNRYGTLGLLY
jgi:hypothetical protein